MNFSAEKNLDDLVKKAMSDPAFRPQFYREFLEFDMYAVGEAVGDFHKTSDGVFLAGQNTSLRLIVHNVNGKKQVPIFSSVPKLEAALGAGANYVCANARIILQTIPEGIEVMLNPGSPFGKLFVSAEIRQMVDGSIFKTPESHVIDQNQKILLGQPAEFPHKLVNALISYFESTQYADKGYLAEMFVPGSGEQPHCVIGIEVSTASGKVFEQILSEIAIIANTSMPAGQFVDFVEVIGPSTLVDHLLHETKPFYVR